MLHLYTSLKHALRKPCLTFFFVNGDLQSTWTSKLHIIGSV
jgi:hypothetical protein